MTTRMRIEKVLSKDELERLEGKIRKECIVDEINREDGTTHKTLRIYTSTDMYDITYVIGRLNELQIFNCNCQRITI